MEPIPWTIQDILTATGGELVCGLPGATFARVSIDSRSISKDDLFVAIKGERYDGHNFIRDVVSGGVAGVVACRETLETLPVEDFRKKGVCCVQVPDTIRALGDMAAFQRRRTGIPVAAITGSNGKTTTREMAAAVAGQKYNILSTPGNFNNEIGLPLTLLRLGRSHGAAVVELGMNHPGEISRLGEICFPDIGVVTNIGPAHLEGLGTIEAVMTAKGELIERVKNDGCLVLNGDDPYCVRLGGMATQDVLYFGQSKYADIRAEKVIARGVGTAFELQLPDARTEIELTFPGRFMVSNALAASATGHLLGLSAEQIKSGIEAFRPVKGRMDLLETGTGVFVIDDTYNANPGSMEAAVQTLVSLKGGSRGVFVAGDMLELGQQAEALHEDLGRLAARSGLARLCVTGEFAEAVARGARNAGMAASGIVTGDKSAIMADLLGFLKPGDWVLVKGSRGMSMEEIVYHLIKETKPAA